MWAAVRRLIYTYSRDCTEVKLTRSWDATYRRLVIMRAGGVLFFFFSSRRRHTRCSRDWSSDVCSSDLRERLRGETPQHPPGGRQTLPRSTHERGARVVVHVPGQPPRAIPEADLDSGDAGGQDPPAPHDVVTDCHQLLRGGSVDVEERIQPLTPSTAAVRRDVEVRPTALLYGHAQAPQRLGQAFRSGRTGQVGRETTIVAIAAGSGQGAPQRHQHEDADASDDDGALTAPHGARAARLARRRRATPRHRTASRQTRGDTSSRPGPRARRGPVRRAALPRRTPPGSSTGGIAPLAGRRGPARRRGNDAPALPRIARRRRGVAPPPDARRRPAVEPCLESARRRRRAAGASATPPRSGG